MKGKILGERYEILEKVGCGGMAIVYKAKCQLLNRNVAIKILRDEFIDDEEFIKKFRRESQAAASLSHPNIVNVYDVGEEEIDGKKIYYIVMEFILGKTLKETIREKKHLNTKETLNYSIQIAEALEHAHRNHIIHRDIKPHNIMITDDNRAKVMDFGIARAATSSTVTNTSNVIGSVHYFSPEQARGGYTDERSDLYSLGIVMYEMLTGRLPFEGETPVTVALKHVQEEMKSVREIDPSIPESLDNIILKLTQKSPDDRYQKAGDLIEDLINISNNINHVVNSNNDKFNDSATQVVPIVNNKTNEESNSKFENTAEIDVDDNIIKFQKDEEKYIKSQEKKRKKEQKSGGAKIYIMAILLALVLVSVGGLTIIKAKEWFYVGEIEVPKIVGKYENEAREELEKLGLKLEVENYITSTEFEKDQIINQEIEAGSKVKSGYTIKVNVSKGLEQVKIPTLYKHLYDEARIKLENLGLAVGLVDYEFSEDIEADRVISQSPDPGSLVDTGTEIDLLISKGPENVKLEMPNLVGRSETEAKSLIVTSGLVMNGSPTKEHSDKPEGEVIWQSIDPGQEIEKNTSVSITVSLGKEIIEEPEEEKPTEPENTDTEISFNYRVSFDEIDSDRIEVVISRVQDGETNNAYTGTFNKEEREAYITLTGKKGAIFEVYLNGSHYETTVIN